MDCQILWDCPGSYFHCSVSTHQQILQDFDSSEIGRLSSSVSYNSEISRARGIVENLFRVLRFFEGVSVTIELKRGNGCMWLR